MRLSGRDEQELRWYFFEYPSAYASLGGLRSNVGPVIDYLELGARIQVSPQQPDPLRDAGVFHLANRARSVERSLARMPRAAVRVLKRILADSIVEELSAPIGPEHVVMTDAERSCALEAVAENNQSRIVVLRMRARASYRHAIEEWEQAKPARRRTDVAA